MIQQQALRPTRTIAILAISASLLVAAVGFSVLSAQVVRDPQNPAFVGNTVGSLNTTTSSQTVRDPENPAYAGNTVSAPSTSGTQLRDPENPYWTGATTSETSGATRGATQGLR